MYIHFYKSWHTLKPFVPSFPNFVNGGKKVYAPSNVRIHEAAAVVQHSPCSNTAGHSVQRGRGSLNYLIQSLLWHNTSSQQSSIYNPLISFPHNSYYEALSEANCSKSYKSSAFRPKSSPKSPVTQTSGSGVSRDSCGKALQGRQVGFSNKSTTCTPPASLAWCCCWPPHDHGKSHASHLACEARETSSRATKTDLSCKRHQ